VFTWDPAKNRSNQKKHGISFETACLVFEDPFHISRLERVMETEERWQTIGSASGVRLLVVAHTVRERPPDEPEIRIISARLASRTEREVYEEGR